MTDHIPTEAIEVADMCALLKEHSDSYDIDCGEWFGCTCGWTEDVEDVARHQAEVLLNAGFTRRPMPSREQVARALDYVNRTSRTGWAIDRVDEQADAILNLLAERSDR